MVEILGRIRDIMSTNKENLDLITSYFLRKGKSATEVGLFEFGMDFCRFDCLIVIGNRQRIRGYEFKVDRSDFLKEIKTGKWKQYLEYCHTFSFVCPKGLIKKSEVPSKVGLLWVTKVNEFPTGLWIKRPHFLGKIPEDKFRRILLVLLSRVKYRKDDFF